MRQPPSDEEITKLLELLFSRHRIYPVYLSAEPQTSLERTLGREPPGSRIAFLPRDEALQRLQRHQNVIQSLYQISSDLSHRGGLCISASQSVSKNSERVMDEALKILVTDREDNPDDAIVDLAPVILR